MDSSSIIIGNFVNFLGIRHCVDYQADFLGRRSEKIVQTGQGIAAKADDIIDNVKGMTSVGGIVKTFANRVMENQERRYAEEDAARAAAAEEMAKEAAAAEKEARAAVRAGAKVKAAASKVKVPPVAPRKLRRNKTSCNKEKCRLI